MRLRKCFFWSFLLVLPVLFGSARAGENIRVSPDLELYYVDAGTGTPMIFVPGWCATTEFFTEHQIPHFSKNYRAIAFDPRGHGRSSKTMENNNYIQHAKDLHAFMQALQLSDVILVGWSAGCENIYTYLRLFGAPNIKACVFIDTPPKSLKTHQDDWGWLSNLSEARDFIKGTVYDRRGFMTEQVQLLMEQKMTRVEIDWAVDQVLMTPTYIAALLAMDSVFFADYTQEAKEIDGKIPVINIVSEDVAVPARRWLRENAPSSEIVVMGKHAMFWEFPNEFNAAVDAFLAKTK